MPFIVLRRRSVTAKSLVYAILVATREVAGFLHYRHIQPYRTVGLSWDGRAIHAIALYQKIHLEPFTYDRLQHCEGCTTLYYTITAPDMHYLAYRTS